MKQGFHPQWVAYQRLLKQRNSLLKDAAFDSVQLAELRSWDKVWKESRLFIHHYRERIFAEWQPYFADSVAQLLPSYAEQLSLSYNAGYDTSVALDNAAQWALRAGFTAGLRVSAITALICMYIGALALQ